MIPGRLPTVLLFLISSFASAQTLRFVADHDYPPVTSLRGGQPAGIYVDIARAVAQELKQPYRIEVEEWSKAQAEVAEGAADVLYSVSYTKERSERFDFTVPVTHNYFAFFSRDGGRGPDTLEDLPGLRVGVTQGGLPRRLIEGLPGVVTLPFASYHDGFEALANGLIDAFAGDLWVGSYSLLQEHRLSISPSRQVFASLPAGFAVKKGNQALVDKLNVAIARLQAAGTFEAILNRWDPEAVIIQTKGQVSAAILTVSGSVLAVVLLALLVWVYLLRREIKQRRAAEVAKESLLKELHHRTRNNMAVINALLELQAVTGDPKLSDTLRQTQNQIFAMALVHDRLYKTEELSSIGLRAYIDELVPRLAASYRLDPDRLVLRTDIEDVRVLIDTAVPLGLILNELVGNAIRHGFPPPRRGEIAVTLLSSADNIEITVADTGIGFPPGFDPRLGGLGLQTVLKLAEEQLKASVTFHSDQGVRVTMVFHGGYYGERVQR